MNQVSRDSDLADERHWLPSSKLRSPTVTSGIISRQRLLDKLQSYQDPSFSLFVAPAGYGKSTLLAQWFSKAEAEGKICAWINLDEADSDPNQLLALIILALDSAGLEMRQLTHLANVGLAGSSMINVLQRTANTIADSERKILLCLDDYHQAQGHDSDKVLRELSEQSCGKLSICLSTRDASSLQLTNLLLREDVAIVDSQDLKFKDSEVREIFGDDLSDEEYRELLNTVEGWPVALKMAKLLLDSASENENRVAVLHGHTGHLANYLTDQVVSNLPPELQDFLLKTSILDTFNAQLADAVCEHSSSREYLRRLTSLHALLIPLDAEQENFRYHHLFAECLSDLLIRKYPESYEDLHLKAAYWLGEQHRIGEAVRHARAIKCYEVWAKLICDAGGWELILFRGIGHLAGLLRKFPESELVRFPRLQLAKSYLLLKQGEVSRARACFDAACSSRQFSRSNHDSMRDYTNLRVLLSFYEDNLWVKNDNEFLEKAIKSADMEDSITRGVLQCGLVLRHIGFGDFASAEKVAQASIRSMLEGNSSLGLNYAMLHLGLIAFYQGNYRTASLCYQKADEMASDNFEEDSGLKPAADVYKLSLAFWQGNLDSEGILRLETSVYQICKYDGWFESFAVGFDALCTDALFTRNVERMKNYIRLMRDTGMERGVKRLELLADAFELIYFVVSDNMSEAAILYEIVSRNVISNTGELQSSAWIVKIFASFACTEYLIKTGASLEALKLCRNIQILIDDIGANFFMIRCHINKSSILYLTYRRKEAVDSIVSALQLAAPGKLKQPFQNPVLVRLLRLSRDRVRFDKNQTLALNLISEILGRCGKNQSVLSDRELRILDELSFGKSNKEIGNELNLTENTVKFHLKNIFRKLKVNRRLQAISAAKEQKLL